MPINLGAGQRGGKEEERGERSTKEKAEPQPAGKEKSSETISNKFQNVAEKSKNLLTTSKYDRKSPLKELYGLCKKD